MLAALLLLGILPFAAMPLIQGAIASDEQDSDESTDSISNTTVTQHVGLGDNPEEDPDPDPEVEVGTTYNVDATPGNTLIEDFRPGIDSVDLDLSSLNGNIFFDMGSTADGAVLSVSIGDETVSTFEFNGLSEVPTGDVFITTVDDETGEAFQISLADAMTEAVLDPVDPGLPDPPGPEVAHETIVSPSDPEEPDAPGPEVSVDEVILDPLDPDAGPVTASQHGALTDALVRDSDNSGGAGEVAQEIAETGMTETVFGSGDDSIALADDGVPELAELELVEGTAHINSDAAVDVIDGGAGDDTIATGDEAAYAFGGEGNDVLTSGNSVAALYGGAGDDQLSSGGDEDTSAYLDGGAGDDTISGGAGDDVLEGGEHAASQAAGNDLIDGGAGDNVIRGGYGADTLNGGDGDDVIDHLGNRLEREGVTQHEFAWHIDGEDDVLTGGAGEDTLIFDDGDTATGGEGEDLFWVYHSGADGTAAADVLDFKVGEDFLRVSLNPQIGENGEPEVQVVASGDGADGLVIVNGDVVAILRGAPGATASDVYAEVKLDVFS